MKPGILHHSPPWHWGSSVHCSSCFAASSSSGHFPSPWLWLHSLLRVLTAWPQVALQSLQYCHGDQNGATKTQQKYHGILINHQSSFNHVMKFGLKFSMRILFGTIKLRFKGQGHLSEVNVTIQNYFSFWGRKMARSDKTGIGPCSKTDLGSYHFLPVANFFWAPPAYVKIFWSPLWQSTEGNRGWHTELQC